MGSSVKAQPAMQDEPLGSDGITLTAEGTPATAKAVALHISHADTPRVLPAPKSLGWGLGI